jgi:hypothetical protein
LRPRTYVVAAMALATLWLVATMAANILIDPQGVFGTDLVRGHFNPNGRYLALRAYQAAPERYDAVLFASSRGNAFDRAFLAERMGVRGVANFSVPFGLLTDHLPVLEFLLRDKAARGGRIAAVFLVLDADFFGKQPWTNVNIDSFLPPQISGESPARFWWRYLTAFQLKLWRKDLGGSAGGARTGSLDAGVISAAFLPAGSLKAIAARLAPVVKTSMEETSVSEIRSDLARQLELLARFVALCRAHDIRLAVAFSPLNRRNADDDRAPGNERIIDAVAGVTPVWDFDRPQWLSDRPDLWRDLSHYSPEVAAMMVDRVFGPTPSAPTDFGTLRAR